MISNEVVDINKELVCKVCALEFCKIIVLVVVAMSAVKETEDLAINIELLDTILE